MYYWMVWLIVGIIGLVVGAIIHGIFRFAQGPSVLTTLIAGIVGALVAAYIVTNVIMFSTTSYPYVMYLWGLLGSIVLSLITEALFVGSRRGRVVTI